MEPLPTALRVRARAPAHAWAVRGIPPGSERSAAAQGIPEAVEGQGQ